MTSSDQTKDDAELAAARRKPIGDGIAACETPYGSDGKSNPVDLSEPMNQAGQAAVDGRDPDRPASNRRAIGIKFGIDPSNLYEAPADNEVRDRAVGDLD